MNLMLAVRPVRARSWTAKRPSCLRWRVRLASGASRFLSVPGENIRMPSESQPAHDSPMTNQEVSVILRNKGQMEHLFVPLISGHVPSERAAQALAPSPMRLVSGFLRLLYDRQSRRLAYQSLDISPTRPTKGEDNHTYRSDINAEQEYVAGREGDLSLSTL